MRGAADILVARLGRRPYLALGIALVTTGLAEMTAWGTGVATTDAALLGFLLTAPFFLAVPLLGGALVRRHPANPLGWIFSAAGVAFALLALSTAYAYVDLSPHHDVPAGRWGGLLSSVIWIYSIPLVGTYGALLFPDGRLPSRRWRVLGWTVGAMLIGLPLGIAFSRELLTPLPYRSPLALPGAAGTAASVLLVFLIFLPLTTCASAASLVRRARHDPSLRLPAGAAVLIGLSFVGCIAWPGGEPGVFVPPEAAAVIACVGATVIAVRRYGLFDLRRVVGRAAVYLLLSTGVLAVSILAAVGFGALFGGRLPLFLAAATAALVAQPMHRILQERVERFVWGARSRPYDALATLGEKIASAPAPSDLMPAIAESIARALRSPYVEIVVPDVPEATASIGSSGAGQSFGIPLVAYGETVGRLIVESRDADDRFTRADRKLLEALAQNVAVAVRTVELAAGLQASRWRLVSAREAERRRLRRDLHDGLGPTLAGLGLGIDAARGALPEGRARALLDDARRDLDTALLDIRRLVHSLRPPTLDQLGLVGALCQEAARPTPLGPRVEVEAATAVPDLPAAAEVAAYRIALEAITNARRHSRADRCTVKVAVNGALELEIRDDGRGIAPGQRPGVGMTSMHERVDELGGRLTILPLDPGTLVHAVIPIAAA